MVRNIKLKCKCGSILISSPPWTNITPAKQVVCTWAVAFLHSDRQRVEDPEEQSQSKMRMMTLDSPSWTRLRWVLKSVCREAWEMGKEGAVLTCGTSDQHYCAISNFLHRDFWTATCELVVNTDKQAKLKVRSLRICLFTLHTYSSDCAHVLVFVHLPPHVFMHTHTDKDLVYPLLHHLRCACHLPAHSLWPRSIKL